LFKVELKIAIVSVFLLASSGVLSIVVCS